MRTEVARKAKRRRGRLGGKQRAGARGGERSEQRATRKHAQG
jgi:hypothetical protein